MTTKWKEKEKIKTEYHVTITTRAAPKEERGMSCLLAFTEMRDTSKTVALAASVRFVGEGCS